MADSSSPHGNGGAPPPPRARALGHVLVVLQLLLIAWLGLRSLPRFIALEAPLPSFALMGAALALLAWALTANRPGNFAVHPEPSRRARMVSAGPYRFIRHPMYVAALVGAAAAAWALRSVDAYLTAAALIPVLLLKARLEERWMLQRFAAYAAYRQRTGLWLPRLW